MKKLKTYLKVNSLFSFATGVCMSTFSNHLLTLFNIQKEGNRYLFDIIGLLLIIFSFFVMYVSIKQIYNGFLVKLISVLDILWVLGSMIIVAFQLFNLSNTGYSAIVMVAIWIGFLAYGQLQNVKHLT